MRWCRWNRRILELASLSEAPLCQFGYPLPESKSQDSSLALLHQGKSQAKSNSPQAWEESCLKPTWYSAQYRLVHRWWLCYQPLLKRQQPPQYRQREGREQDWAIVGGTRAGILGAETRQRDECCPESQLRSIWMPWLSLDLQSKKALATSLTSGCSTHWFQKAWKDVSTRFQL